MKRMGVGLSLFLALFILAGCEQKAGKADKTGAAEKPETPEGKAPAKSEFLCDGQAFTLLDHEYCISNLEFTFDAAAKKCEAMGGRLVTIDSDQQAKALHQKLGSPWGYDWSLWIGLSDAKAEGAFKWDSGAGPAFTAWERAEPNNGGGKGDPENCVEWFVSSGKWSDTNCANQTGSLCESPVGKTAPDCEGFKFATPASNYCAVTRNKTYADAKAACAEAGMKIAEIADEAENKAIFAAIGTPSGLTGGFWIGLTDQAKEGQWRWLAGAEAGYANWADGEPNNSGDEGENCAMGAIADGKWVDVACDEKMKFLCEAK